VRVSVQYPGYLLAMGAAVCCPCGRQGDIGQPLQCGQQMTQQMSVAERIKVLNARPSTLNPNLGDEVRNAPTQAPKPTPSLARQIGGEPPSPRPAGAAQTTVQTSSEHAAKSSHAVVQISERTTVYASTQTPSPQRQEKSSPSQAAPQSLELKLAVPENQTVRTTSPRPRPTRGVTGTEDHKQSPATADSQTSPQTALQTCPRQAGLQMSPENFGKQQPEAPAPVAIQRSSLDDEVLQWVEAVSGESKGSQSLMEWLKDGQVLCRIANKIEAGICPRINTSSMPFKQMENVSAFTQACRKLGVLEKDVFSTVDLYEAKDSKTVMICIASLGSHIRHTAPGFKGPYLGVAQNCHITDTAREKTVVTQNTGFRTDIQDEVRAGVRKGRSVA